MTIGNAVHASAVRDDLTSYLQATKDDIMGLAECEKEDFELRDIIGTGGGVTLVDPSEGGIDRERLSCGLICG